MSGRNRHEKRGIPHTAIVFSDWNDRNRLIDDVLAGTDARWSGSIIMSAQPDKDAKFFGKKAKSEPASRSRSPPATYDVGEFLSHSRDPTDEILPVFRAARKGSQGASSLTFMGDWPHLCYGEFDVVLHVERTLEEESFTPICGYRKEGFFSLDPKHIIGVYETHRRVILGSAISQMPD